MIVIYVLKIIIKENKEIEEEFNLGNSTNNIRTEVNEV